MEQNSFKIEKLALTFDDVQICPTYSEIESRTLCNTEARLTKKYKVKIPICASPMDTVCEVDMAKRMTQLGGVGFVHRFCTIEEQRRMVEQSILGQPVETLVGAAVGVKGDYIERAIEMCHVGCRIILIDVAHGDHINVKKALEELKKNLSKDTDIIAGNVSTTSGANNLCEWGADAVRVGIGPGSMCTTRVNTGVGIPQISAILDCVSICDRFVVPVIADGGIRYPGDVAKAIAAGASTVMLGSLLAGTKETPGRIQKIGQWPNEQLYKTYRGSASLDTKIAHGMEEKNVEGASRVIPYKGKAERIVNDILDGLRSSMSYTNARNIEEFREFTRFVQITNAGQIEAQPHLMNQK